MLIVLTGIKTFGGNFELFKFLTALWIRIRRVDMLIGPPGSQSLVRDQCRGSGSGTGFAGSACFWAIRIWMANDHWPFVRGADPDPSLVS